MSSIKTTFWSHIFGKCKPATMYMLVYTAYILAFANDMNVYLIRLLYGAFYAMTAWYTIQCLSYLGSSKYVKYLFLLFLLFVVYGVILLITGTTGWMRQIDPSSFLTYYLPSILPIFSFYYFGMRGYIDEKWFRAFFALFFLNVVMQYFKEERTILENSLMGEGDFINNTGYTIASLLPLICFFDKRKAVQYTFAVIIFAFIMITYKRGAVICAAITFIYFIYVSMKNTKSTNKISTFIVVVAAIFFMSRYVENLMDSNEFFNKRVAESLEGNSSGRDELYTFFFDYFFSAENGLNIFFGNGAKATARIFGQVAHNDWLEFAIDFGVLGLVIYLLYWVSIYKNIRFARGRIGSAFRTAVVMCVIFNFSRTFISMSIGNMSIVSACVFGCGMGLIDSERRSVLDRN